MPFLDLQLKVNFDSDSETTLKSIKELDFSIYFKDLVRHNALPQGGFVLVENNLHENQLPLKDSWIGESGVDPTLLAFAVLFFHKQYGPEKKHEYKFSNVDHSWIELKMNAKKITVTNTCLDIEYGGAVTYEMEFKPFFEQATELINFYLLLKNTIPSNYKYYEAFNFKSFEEIFEKLQNPYLRLTNKLVLLENFISEEEETELLNTIDSNLWSSELKRRVQHYGYRYNYKSKVIEASMHLGEVPSWLTDLSLKIDQQTKQENKLDQFIINEYLPGQGISAHIDCVPCFGNTIFSLSLGSGCNMVFTDPKTKEKISYYLPQRSLLVLKDELRYEWKHEIKAVKSDLVNAAKIPRSRRVSITFRTIKKRFQT
ncbi:MAG: hypothetical protein RL264_645 [Bacteroidota bacterium]